MGTLSRVAVGQMSAAAEWESNLDQMSHFTKQAAAAGASTIVFPEYAMSWGNGPHVRDQMSAVAQPLTGPFVSGLSRLAADTGMWIIAGLIESGDDEKELRPFNAVVVVDGTGSVVQTYRKSHLFDAFRRRESSIFAPGADLAPVFQTPLGPSGVFVCYELRFPEVSRSLVLNGAKVLIVPSAWVAGPLKDLHWETLIRARAIENGCYVVASAHAGHEFNGQSMIADPMGVICAAAGIEPGVIFAGIDSDRIDEVRQTVPSIKHRRPELY